MAYLRVRPSIAATCLVFAAWARVASGLDASNGEPAAGGCELILRSIPAPPASLLLPADLDLEATVSETGRVSTRPVQPASPEVAEWLATWVLGAPPHASAACPVRYHHYSPADPVLTRVDHPVGYVALQSGPVLLVTHPGPGGEVSFGPPPSVEKPAAATVAPSPATVEPLHKDAPAMESTVRGKKPEDGNVQWVATEEELQRVPGAYGDPIRGVTSLPGVARGPVGLGPLVLQGGRIGDTQSFIDEEPVPTLFHFDGWTSILPAQMLSQVDLLPSPTSIDLGRSVAGAVDAQTRVGNANHFAGSLDISTGAAGVYLEGPLPGGASFQASFRRSYLELFEPLVQKYAPEAGLNVPVIPQYTDYGARVDFPRVGGGRLSVLAYGSVDAANVDFAGPNEASFFDIGGADGHLEFHRISATWTSLPPETIRRMVSLVLGYDNDYALLGDGLFLRTQAASAAARFNVSGRLPAQLSWGAGLDVTASSSWLHALVPTPPADDELLNASLLSEAFSVKQDVTWVAPALWGRLIWRPGYGIELTPAVRVDYDSLLNRAWADPRATFYWAPRERFALRGGIGLAHQRPSPEKLLPVIGNPHLHEEAAFDATAGLRLLLGGPLTLEGDFYSRTLYSAAVRTDVPGDWSPQPVPGNQLYTNNGQGYAYGVEAILRLALWHGLFGWVAASAGPSEQRASPSDRWEPVPFTQTFNVSGVLSWDIWRGFVIGTRVRYTDGSPSVGVQGAIFDSDTENYIPIPTVPWWTLRTPAFFQLDLRIEKRWDFAKWSLAAYVDVQNLTDYDNIEFYSYNYNYSQLQPIHGIGIFPMIGLRGSLK